MIKEEYAKEMEAIADSYKSVFLETKEGQKVLEHLKKINYVGATPIKTNPKTHSIDTNFSMFNAGKQAAILNIIAMVESVPGQFENMAEEV